MQCKFKLSGENYRLSKFELETLLNKKLKSKSGFVSVFLKLDKKEILEVCKRSAMVQKLYLKGRKIWDARDQKRFKMRQPKEKLKSHPAMLKPKLARLLVNLSGAQKQVLDPFCGTGSILIEAGILGLDPIGSDIDEKMLGYAKVNLEQFGVRAKLRRGDATKLKRELGGGSVEAIACDPPYGRCSSLAGKKIGKLYSDFLESAHSILRKKGRLIISCPDSLRLRIKSGRWKVLGRFSWYVHGSLTRIVLILSKK